jgi:septal ring-binding cell division protein DamX
VASSPGPTPKPVTTPRATAATVARGEFTLQVVSYGEEAQAEGEVTRLTHQGYKDVFLTVGSVAGRTVHRVRIGHYASKSEAEEAASSLAADNPNLKPIVVPLE